MPSPSHVLSAFHPRPAPRPALLPDPPPNCTSQYRCRRSSCKCGNHGEAVHLHCCAEYSDTLKNVVAYDHG